MSFSFSCAGGGVVVASAADVFFIPIDAAAAAAADDDEETIFFVFFFFFEANVEDAVGDDDGLPARASGRALMNAESAATNPDATVRAADESAFPMPACGTARRRSGAGRRKIQPRGSSDLV